MHNVSKHTESEGQKLHPGPCACGRGQTHRQTDTQTRVMTTIHFASSTTHAKCNKVIVDIRICPVLPSCESRWIHALASPLPGQLCSDTTSSSKLEVHSLLHCQKRTELRALITDSVSSSSLVHFNHFRWTERKSVFWNLSLTQLLFFVVLFLPHC